MKVTRDLAAGFHLGAYARVEAKLRDANEVGGATCQLAAWDPLERRCVSRLEAFHYVGRQRIRNALGALDVDPALITICEWDDRNGSVACEAHHRRLDSHMTPTLRLPRMAIPDIVWEFAQDWGLELQLERKLLEALVA